MYSYLLVLCSFENHALMLCQGIVTLGCGAIFLFCLLQPLAYHAIMLPPRLHNTEGSLYNIFKIKISF